MGLGGNGDMMGTDAIPTDQLEGLDSQAPEDLEAQQMVEALQDPSTPPEVRAAIEADLQMAARRKMAGGGL